MEFSPTYGHAMSVPVNFRKVDLNEIKQIEGKLSLLDTLSTTSDNSVLDQTMFLYPYEVTLPSCEYQKRTNVKPDDRMATIMSLVRGNYTNGQRD